jgi:phage-related minor tail protein
MKQAILQLKQKKDEFRVKKENLETAITALENIPEYKKYYMESIKFLKDDAEILGETITSINKTLLALQKVCDHKNPDGTSAFVIIGNSETILQTKKCEICNLLIKV